jgi:NADH-quinone oxidoreductase subunit N
VASATSLEGAASQHTLRLVAQLDSAAEDAQEAKEAAKAETALSPVRTFFVTIVAIVGIVSCTFGNLAAYGQKNIKRMLAYSTIAHAGFMMMPIAAAVALMGTNSAAATEAIAALLLYATIYLFMNLGAFAIVAFLRNSTQSEEIKDYAGLIGRSPVIAVAMTLILVSLVGLPPLAGFWPKLRVLQALYEAGGPLLMFVMVAAAINTAISLVYYLRVAKTMCIDSPPDTSRPVQLDLLATSYVVVLTLPVVLLGFLPDRVAQWTQQAAAGLFG